MRLTDNVTSPRTNNGSSVFYWVVCVCDHGSGCDCDLYSCPAEYYTCQIRDYTFSKSAKPTSTHSGRFSTLRWLATSVTISNLCATIAIHRFSLPRTVETFDHQQGCHSMEVFRDLVYLCKNSKLMSYRIRHFNASLSIFARFQ